MPRTIHVLMDLPPSQQYYSATMSSLEHAIAAANADTQVKVVGTNTIEQAFIDNPGHGVLIGPGSPYDRPDLAEEVIRSAREQGIPLVGT